MGMLPEPGMRRAPALAGLMDRAGRQDDAVGEVRRAVQPIAEAPTLRHWSNGGPIPEDNDTVRQPLIEHVEDALLDPARRGDSLIGHVAKTGGVAGLLLNDEARADVLWIDCNAVRPAVVQDHAVGEQPVDHRDGLVELASPDILIGPDLGHDELVGTGQGRRHYFLRLLTAALAMRTARPSSPVSFRTLLATSDHCFLAFGLFAFLVFPGAALGFQGI